MSAVKPHAKMGGILALLDPFLQELLDVAPTRTPGAESNERSVPSLEVTSGVPRGWAGALMPGTMTNWRSISILGMMLQMLWGL